MARVHPNSPVDPTEPFSGDRRTSPEALTVWRKSLLFNGNGFTVFDSAGNLAFRVDNYSLGSRPEIVLMDSNGKPLFTIRKKRFSLGEQWLIYNGEEVVNPCFAVKKHMNPLNSKALAHVTHCTSSGKSGVAAFDIEGSYSQRCCVVYDGRRQQLAEIKRKENDKGIAFGGDVFRLVVQPGLDTAFTMAIVILLDQIYGGGSGGSFLKG